MSVIGIDGYRASLARQLTAADTDIQLRRQDAIKLNVIGVGNHTYLTIWDPVKTEVVRYDHVEDWDATDPAVVSVPVVRDMGGLGLRSFAYGTCIEFRVTSFHLEDLVAAATSVDCAPEGMPESSESAELPTAMYGARDALLGNPDGFIALCEGRLVPYYSAFEPGE